MTTWFSRMLKWLERHYSRVWLVYTVVIVAGWLVPLPIPYLYPALLIGYVALSIAWFRRSNLWLGGSSSGEFLCDTCRFDYGDVCRRPERPNATKCPDYEKG